MESNQTLYALARENFLTQQKNPYAYREIHVLRKQQGVDVSFKALLKTWGSLIDELHDRRHEERRPQDEQGRQQFSEGFAYVDRQGIGLYVRVRETGEDDGPSYTYFHASSVGLDKVVLSADLALLDDCTLEPLKTPDILSVTILADVLQDRLEEIHATIARVLAQQGYRSDCHPLAAQVAALWKLPCWPDHPDHPGQPLKRLNLALTTGCDEPSVDILLAALARIYDRLSNAAPLDPAPVQTTGKPGLAAYFLLCGDATHGLLFVWDVVDYPEQLPPGTNGIALRSVGLPDLFLSCPRILSLGENEKPDAMKVEPCFAIHLTGTEDEFRFNLAIQAVAEELGKLGYSLLSIDSTTAGCFPD